MATLILGRGFDATISTVVQLDNIISQKEIIVKDLVHYMSTGEGYRIIAGSIALQDSGSEEDDKVVQFPYIRRIKKKTFNDDFSFNELMCED